jgi:hypothetical protein
MGATFGWPFCVCEGLETLGADEHRQHHQRNGDDCDLPEIRAPSQSRQTDGPDEMQQHGGKQERGEDFRHDGLSPLFLSHLRHFSKRSAQGLKIAIMSPLHLAIGVARAIPIASPNLRKSHA